MHDQHEFFELKFSDFCQTLGYRGVQEEDETYHSELIFFQDSRFLQQLNLLNLAILRKNRVQIRANFSLGSDANKKPAAVVILLQTLEFASIAHGLDTYLIAMNLDGSKFQKRLQKNLVFELHECVA